MTFCHFRWMNVSFMSSIYTSKKKKKWGRDITLLFLFFSSGKLETLFETRECLEITTWQGWLVCVDSDPSAVEIKVKRWWWRGEVGKKEVFQLSPLSFSSLPLMFYLFIYLFLDLSSSVFVSPPWCIFGVVVFSSLLSTRHCCKCRRSKGVKKSVCPFAVNILQVTVNPLWLCSVA